MYTCLILHIHVDNHVSSKLRVSQPVYHDIQAVHEVKTLILEYVNPCKNYKNRLQSMISIFLGGID